MNLRIGLDIDGVIADFSYGYIRRFGKFPKKDWCITRNVHNILINEREFWLSLPVIRTPNFVPKLFCSARVNKKCWTKKYLVNLGLTSPLFQVAGYNVSKYPTLKGRVDVFIDDSLKNFKDLNLHGIPCLLMDSPDNKEWGPIGRIFSLNEEEINTAYQLFYTSIFPNFKNLV